MAKYVPDTKTKRWVILSPTRYTRPSDQKLSTSNPASPAGRSQLSTSSCPFCPGNESQTPPEVYRVGPGGPNEKGWVVRVTPNKYPITDIHEVILLSESHTDDFLTLPEEQTKNIFRCFRDRFLTHRGNGQVLIFCNAGKEAGASLTHAHAQLVVVPNQIPLDALSREPVKNVIAETDTFSIYCPDFSQWPLEVWLAPRGSGTSFGDATDRELNTIATLLPQALRSIKAVYDAPEFHGGNPDIPFSYNFYIAHTTNWFVRIIPRFIYRAGFELGTGLSVNTIEPDEASEMIKKVWK